MASTRLNNSTMRILSREATSSPMAAGKEASLARCRNYASASKKVSSSMDVGNSQGTLISSQNMPYMVSRSLSTSVVSSAEASTSQSTKPSSSSARQTVQNGHTAVPAAAPGAGGLLGSIAKIMGYDTRTSAAIRTTSDYYDRCSERDEKEGTFWYDGEPLFLPIFPVYSCSSLS